MPIDVNGKSLEVDEEGYLSNLNDWEPAVAEVMAKAEDLELTDDHWEIINFLREYYEEYQIAPAVRVLTKAVGKKLGKEKATTDSSVAVDTVKKTGKTKVASTSESSVVVIGGKPKRGWGLFGNRTTVKRSKSFEKIKKKEPKQSNRQRKDKKSRVKGNE